MDNITTNSKKLVRLLTVPDAIIKARRMVWTNSQVERINRTIREATVLRYSYYHTTRSAKWALAGLPGRLLN